MQSNSSKNFVGSAGKEILLIGGAQNFSAVFKIFFH
jgi:hypothetical protein